MTTSDRILAGATPFATVTYWPFRHGHPLEDNTESWTGPIIDENTDYIVLNVMGEPMTLPKSRTIVMERFHRG